MVDYDGQDAIITYLSGLDWTALSEPTYLKYFTQKITPDSNVVIVQLINITPQRTNESEYFLNHSLIVNYIHDTKANLWPNFKYILKNLWELSDSSTQYILNKTIPVNQTEDRKIYQIPVNYLEVLEM